MGLCRRGQRKVKVEEICVAQGMTRTNRVYTPEHLRGTIKEIISRPHVVETSPRDL